MTPRRTTRNASTLSCESPRSVTRSRSPASRTNTANLPPLAGDNAYAFVVKQPIRPPQTKSKLRKQPGRPKRAASQDSQSTRRSLLATRRRSRAAPEPEFTPFPALRARSKPPTSVCEAFTPFAEPFASRKKRKTPTQPTSRPGRQGFNGEAIVAASVYESRSILRVSPMTTQATKKDDHSHRNSWYRHP